MTLFLITVNVILVDTAAKEGYMFEPYQRAHFFQIKSLKLVVIIHTA